MAPAGAARALQLVGVAVAAAATAAAAVAGASAATAVAAAGAGGVPPSLVASAAATRATPASAGSPFLDALAAAHRLAGVAPPAVPTVAAAAPAARPAAAAAADGLAGSIEAVLAAPLATLGGGVSYAVARGGVTLAAGSLGEASVELGVSMTGATRTDVASVSKQFTAFLLYWLDQRGDLSLDDDVRVHVPELPRYANGHTVTLRHLVHHVSGLLDCFTAILLARGGLDDSLPRQTLLASIGRQTRLRFQPGTAWEYSNSNYVLAALVAERVSGKPLARLLREVIFEPLAMGDSDVYDSPARVYPRLAASYTQNRTAAPVPGGPLGVARLRASRRLTAIGTTGIVTTPADLLRWADNFGNNTLGGGRALVDAMETPYVLHAPNGTALPVDYASGGGYGGGVNILDAPINDTTSVRVIYHTGVISGYRSVLLRVPDAGVAIVLQATSSAFAQTFQLAARILALAAPDVLGGGGAGGGGDDPEPTAVDAIPDATDEPMVTPAPPKPVTVSRRALAAAAGVWTMDGVEGAAATFEVQLHCEAPAATNKGGEEEKGGGNEADDSDNDDGRRERAAGCGLFVDLGWYSRSLLVPVSATRFVGALVGMPSALSLEVSPPANRSAPTTAVLSATLPDPSGEATAAPTTATATRHPSLQVGAAALSAAAGTYTSDDLGATYTFSPRGGGLGLALDGVEGRLGSTLLPCCVDGGGGWGGGYTSARPALVFEALTGGKGAWLTMAFGGDTAKLAVEDGGDGRGDLADVPFRRVGTCPA